MATITIFDLHPTGAELFSDSESYMSDLSHEEIFSINGGITTPFCAIVPIVVYITAYKHYKNKH